MKPKKRAHLSRKIALGQRKHQERIEAMRDAGRSRKKFREMFSDHDPYEGAAS
jgi:hypothetical protein